MSGVGDGALPTPHERTRSRCLSRVDYGTRRIGTARNRTSQRRRRGGGSDGTDAAMAASAAGGDRVYHAIVLEEHREPVVVPARDRRLVRSAAHRGMAGYRRAEVLLDFAHGAAALRTIDLRVTHLHLVVHDDGLGDRGTRRGARGGERREHHSGLHGNLTSNSFPTIARSEERRVGKEWRSQMAPYQ